MSNQLPSRLNGTGNIVTADQTTQAYARFLGVLPTPAEVLHAGEHFSVEGRHNCYLQLDSRMFTEPKGTRKNLLVYSSCHCEQIDVYLRKYRQDVLEKCYLHMLFTHRQALNRPHSNNRFVWSLFSEADLVIWNVLGPKFNEQSTDVLGKHLQADAKVVSFVPPCFAAFFAVAEFFGEEGVIEYLVAGRTVENIIALFRDGQFECQFKWRFKDQIDRLAFRERERDVKLSAFVQRHFKQHKLFLTVNHPAFPTLAYLVDECLGILGFKQLGEDHSISREVNEANFGAHLPETHYEFEYFGFTYPLRFQNERGGVDAYYSALISDTAARWKARGGVPAFNDPNDDY